MKVEFEDFYGQKISVSNETASGNIRLKVNTFENINDCKSPNKQSPAIETDISLDAPLLKILIGALQKMSDEE